MFAWWLVIMIFWLQLHVSLCKNAKFVNCNRQLSRLFRVKCRRVLEYIHGDIWDMTKSIGRRHVSRDQKSILWQILTNHMEYIFRTSQKLSYYRILITWNMPPSNAFCHISYYPFILYTYCILQNTPLYETRTLTEAWFFTYLVHDIDGLFFIIVIFDVLMNVFSDRIWKFIWGQTSIAIFI